MDILNRHHLSGPWPDGSVYIGRGTPFGNPFAIGENGDREEVIAAYEAWLRSQVADRDPVILTALAGLQVDSKLVCSCAPKPCHGSVISAVWQEVQDRGGIRPSPKFHDDGALPQTGEVFVFESNLAGRHGAGAALEASEHFGARRGEAMGYQGLPPKHCFAIPTKNEKIATLSVDEIRPHVESFLDFASRHPEHQFFVTRVGCGLAGHKDAEIAPLFRQAPLLRCSFPATWRQHLLPRSMAYAGIGARKTPGVMLNRMHKVAERLEARGYTLRSGGAEGADTAFEEGCRRKQIFLPWRGFNGRESPYDFVSQEARALAAAVHPAFKRLSEQVQDLMARTSYQILGHDLRSPVDFVVCWTPDGAESETERTPATGGTGQAIALADRWNIPVFNLARPDALDRIAQFLSTKAE